MKRLGLFCAFSVVLFSALPVCAGGKSDWLDTVQAAYPESDYISAIGSGKDRASAESSAKLALSQILGESISAEQVTMQYADSRGREEGSIASVVNEKAVFAHITGIVIKEHYADKKSGVQYALAVLNRREAGAFYYTKVDEANGQIASLLTKAGLSRGTWESLSYLASATALAAENEYNMNLLAVINPAQGRMARLSYQTPQAVRTKQREMAAAITVSVHVQGDRDGRVRSAFAAALREKGVSVVEASAAYTLGATLSFERADIADPEHVFVRYTLHAPLTESATGTVVLPYTLTGREGHVTESQAKNRSVIKIENEIKTNYL